MRPKIFIAPGAFFSDVLKLFVRHGYETIVAPDNAKEADILCLTGGSDINPRLYGQHPVPQTHFSDSLDRNDIGFFDLFTDKPKIGICRGGQLLNVLSGGEMYQHVDNHGNNHFLIDAKSKRLIKVTSIHHQMMIPSPTGIVLATAAVSSLRIKGSIVEKDVKYIDRSPNFSDIEAVWYPMTKSLCYQPHPEVDSEEGVKYFFSLVDSYITPHLRQTQE